MAPLDLGLVTLRIRDSQLHLRLKATAHINRLEKDKEAEEQESPSQLHDSSNFWITEAPEIELRFLFFSRNWTLKDAVDTLVSGLGDKLCGLKIWPDLGFSAGINTNDDGENRTSGTCRFKIGLRKGHRVHNHKRRCNLPTMMANPPDVHPPPDVSSVTLASIDISLEYYLHHELLSPGETVQPETLSFRRRIYGASSQLLESQIVQTPMDRSGPAADEYFRLLELGLQKLFVSNSTKDPKVRVSNDTILKSLPLVAPAVFSPGYRETTNQRGVTIPKITKAILTMLKGNQNPVLEAKLVNLLSPSLSLTARAASELSLRTTNLKTAINSRLWHISQQNAPKSKPLRKSSVVFPTTVSARNLVLAENTTNSLALGQQNWRNSLSDTNTNSQAQQNEQLEADFTSLLNESIYQSESEDGLLDNYSETSFIDIGESTQTSLDTLFPTAVSYPTECSDDNNMLFSDPEEMEIYVDGIVAPSYPRQDMDSDDADILTMDGF